MIVCTTSRYGINFCTRFSNRCALCKLSYYTGGWGGVAALLESSAGSLYGSGINVSTLWTDLVEEFTDPTALLLLPATREAPSFIAIILLYMEETAGVVGDAGSVASEVEAAAPQSTAGVIGVVPLRAEETGDGGEANTTGVSATTSELTKVSLSPLSSELDTLPSTSRLLCVAS